MQHIRVKYSKEKELQFIGHLDLVRVFERAVRRSSLPIAYSQGFNPKMRISYGTPLPLGITSDAEYADFEIDGWIKPDILKDELNSKLPPGLKILETKIIGPKEGSLMASAQAVEYLATFTDNTSNVENKIKEIIASEKIVVKRKRKEKIKEIDIRPMIIELSLDDGRLRMLVQSNSQGTAKPNEILSVLGIEEARVKRTRQFVKDHDKLKPM